MRAPYSPIEGRGIAGIAARPNLGAAPPRIKRRIRPFNGGALAHGLGLVETNLREATVDASPAIDDTTGAMPGAQNDNRPCGETLRIAFQNLSGSACRAMKTSQ
jgi:hypothetical protein